jgi:hypothetical protein
LKYRRTTVANQETEGVERIHLVIRTATKKFIWSEPLPHWVASGSNNTISQRVLTTIGSFLQKQLCVLRRLHPHVSRPLIAAAK